MIFGYLSNYMSLQPRDIISTGMPPGLVWDKSHLAISNWRVDDAGDNRTRRTAANSPCIVDDNVRERKGNLTNHQCSPNSSFHIGGMLALIIRD